VTPEDVDVTSERVDRAVGLRHRDDGPKIIEKKINNDSKISVLTNSIFNVKTKMSKTKFDFKCVLNFKTFNIYSLF
jgi:hypothetical protein